MASSTGTPPQPTSKVDLVALGSSCVDQIFAIDDIMRLNLTDRQHIKKKYLAIEVSTKVLITTIVR